MPRLFTCVWVPKELKQKIIKFQDDLKKLPIKAKFIEPENIHITITFIGEIKKEKTDQLKEKIKKTIGGLKQFEVYIKGLKLIPNENYIRVIGIEIKDNKNLTNLMKQVGSCADSKFYESAKITLCRVKNISDKNKIKEFLEKNKNIEIGKFKVTKISLVESVLGQEGPVYRILGEFELL